MKRIGLICLGVLWLGLLGFAGFQARNVARRRAERDALAMQQRQMENDLAAARRAQSATIADLAQARQQLDALPAASGGAATANAEHRAEIERWLVRVQRLRQVFVDHPERRIPEMRFLKEDDWLRVAKAYAMDTDEQLRAAAAELRTAAVGHFVERFSAATRKYSTANKNERPANIQMLAAYFDEPVDPMILERYAVTNRPSTFARGAETWGISNQNPIDPDYDARYQFLPGGGMTIQSGPLAWDQELSRRYGAASDKFRRANARQMPTGVDALLPFFDPPLEPELAERLRKGENRRR